MNFSIKLTWTRECQNLRAHLLTNMSTDEDLNCGMLLCESLMNSTTYLVWFLRNMVVKKTFHIVANMDRLTICSYLFLAFRWNQFDNIFICLVEHSFDFGRLWLISNLVWCYLPLNSVVWCLSIVWTLTFIPGHRVLKHLTCLTHFLLWNSPTGQDEFSDGADSCTCTLNPKEFYRLFLFVCLFCFVLFLVFIQGTQIRIV